VAQVLLTKRGRLVFSRGVNDLVAGNSLFTLHVIVCLQRHVRGDWGDVSLEDKLSNDRALENGEERLFSAYLHKTLPKIWVITEADRSATTVEFPEEY
jgi:hypothetical protein